MDISPALLPERPLIANEIPLKKFRMATRIERLPLMHVKLPMIQHVARQASCSRSSVPLSWVRGERD